jgi:hypothetical protein
VKERAWVSRNGEQDVRKKGPGSVGMVNRMCERKGLHQSHDGYCQRRKMIKTTWSHNLEDQNLGNAMEISKLVMM